MAAATTPPTQAPAPSAAASAGNQVAVLDHVFKVYGSGEAAVSALNDLCLSVRQGEYLAVMGTSGSG